MPESVDVCVSALLAKWNKDPSKRPAPKKAGQDAKGQASAICTSLHQKSVGASLEVMLEGGSGPALIGAAATNRPYIPKLKQTMVIELGGKKKFLVHLANSGHFGHPLGSFTLNRSVFASMQLNFKREVTGIAAAYDARHKPDIGALGWFEELLTGDQVQSALGELELDVDFGEKEFWGLVDPTEAGLALIEGGAYKYSSMDFHRNFNRDDVTLDLESATSDFCDIGSIPEEVEDMPGEKEKNPAGDDGTLKLEGQLGDAQNRIKELEEREKKSKEREQLALDLADTREKETIAASAASVVQLAVDRRDEDGNGLPKQFVDWVKVVLSFGDLGEDSDIVRLSEDVEPSFGVMRYLVGAVRHIVLEMPGTVPAKRKTHGGSGENTDGEDDYDYAAEWED